MSYLKLRETLKEEEYDRLRDMYGTKHVRRMMMRSKVKDSDAFPIKLNVKYKDKDEAKKLGAKWNGKSWYVLSNAKLSKFSKWLDKPKEDKVGKTLQDIILDVPYKEKDAAKKLGAKWNVKLKKWYITVDKNKPKIPKGIDKWMTK